ncbi:MAG: ExbD/TolR family protein [Phycisphaerae bacterium]
MPAGSRSERQVVSFNMTPMIDVVFLLVIFFMIVSQVISSEVELLALPRPYKSQAANQPRLPEKITISLVHDGTGGIARRKAGPNVVRNNEELAAVLLETQRSARQRGHALQVVLRADRNIQFGYVREVMQTIANVGLERMNLAVEAGPNQPRSAGLVRQ